MKKVLIFIFAISFVIALISTKVYSQTYKGIYWNNDNIKPVTGVALKSLNNLYSGCIQNPVIGQEYDADMIVPAIEVSGWQIGIKDNDISFYPVSFGIDYLYVSAHGKLTNEGFSVLKNKFCFGISLSNQLKLNIQSIEGNQTFILNNYAFAGGLSVGTGNGLLTVGYSTNKEVNVKLSWKLNIPNTPLSKLICLH